ncbi:winged helix-turn-helix transcriptional regulator [Mesorhizobium sp. VK23B]|uniref:Winged helix-turn-helix transcriptional regulator n=1 Tax=Mesorhizobium dulcispinae TaxID=3072316 RepID=A0ABU4XLN7_9HYPH|nr:MULTISPECIES: winged helix-turn-helix transcriptional regulator [unclassified Mesorhizobium]MDX8469222.1 winged helix-turn-helix transcriptional regulator [Mesorhizobium sp. VK23B]MDX8475645.1 winged helix-turn-helix transcriptional regulator [Mesorhizobium sp. VK23A]
MTLHVSPTALLPERRRNSVIAAAAAKRDSAEFNHKAIKALAAKGIGRAAIAKLLGLSEATVRRIQYTPCPAYDAEMRELREREDHREPSTRFLSGADIAWEDAMRGSRGDMRAAVQDFLEDLSSGRLTQSDVAQLLGISQQAVSRHVKSMSR